ncbi:glutathione S-transferase family protein [Phenylobacterium sp.]|uniref:glutathione S-transferase family protein n=1 Tax=Phenylobacterium sp. TaxID=1871053 RepID=UPI002732BFE1|nr:glutathione S-transferase family protein [Phenylobacterium sp.]MDP3855375.1 glutathione S-transferase family protein [Phenylobacterium sp.]
MTIQLTAFRWVPPFAQGYVRDLRIRWALEEAGLPYEVVLVDGEALASDRYRQWQPFGQVPAYRDEAVEMFESGAVVLHIAAKSEALSPRDAAGAARVSTWVIAALNSIEPQAQTLVQLDSFYAGQAWTTERRPQAQASLDLRLASLSAWLGDKDYLEGRFTAGDLVMTTVLRELVDCGALLRFPNLEAYRVRCEARPAFGRAMEGQMSAFRENEPA